jgi:lysophospholipase L1-like esterase
MRIFNRHPVVFVGDSITAYWPLRKYLPKSLNAGGCGQTSSQILARFPKVVAQAPAAVAILAGTNDIMRTVQPSVERVMAMATLARDRGAQVILATLPPSEYWNDTILIPDAVRGHEAHQRFNTALLNRAEDYGYPVADDRSAMLLPDGKQDASLFIEDRLHPNEAGYEVMWRTIRPILQASGASVT